MKRRDVQGVKRWEVHRGMRRMKHEDVYGEVHRERRETSSVALPALTGLLLPLLRALVACRGRRHPAAGPVAAVLSASRVLLCQTCHIARLLRRGRRGGCSLGGTRPQVLGTEQATEAQAVPTWARSEVMCRGVLR